MAHSDDLYHELQQLPEQEKLRLVERLIHDLAEAAARRRSAAALTPAGASLIGLWADEPEVVDQVIEGTLRERETCRLRDIGDATHDG